MSNKFSKKNSQKYVVVHRPHDDPHFYDAEASEHVLLPVSNPNDRERKVPSGPSAQIRRSTAIKEVNSNVGEAALYGITFDDSKYDYTQHLKPIGVDPEAVFVPSKTDTEKDLDKKKNIEDMFVESAYRNADELQGTPASVFQRGIAKPEYLSHQQELPEEISGFRPDMNPALREVLEALEDDAYVVNEDIVVQNKKSKKAVEEEEEILDEDNDDIFAELLGGGEVDDAEEFEDEFDEWDIDNLQDYEDDNYRDEIAQFENIDNLEDLEALDYQADIRRFQQEQKQSKKKQNVDAAYSDDDLESIEPLDDDVAEEEEEKVDVLGDLPNIQSKQKTGNKKRKDRRKKGAMSDVSGFSMTSSAIARTEVMTVLDDTYSNIINSYENYEEEQAIDEEETYQPFDMKEERSDFESLLDDFLDNYELESGGRKLAKKDAERDRLKEAADEASRGKLSMRRKRENNKNGTAGVLSSLSGLHL